MAKYKAYPEYKDSGVEWIGNIPSHWEVASLSKLFSIKAGGDVQQSLFSEVCSDDYPYPIYTNANDEFAVYGYTKKANYQSNTITVSGRGDVGFAVYRNHAYDAIIRLLVLAPLKQLECKFYCYFINSVIDFKVESSAIGQLSTQQISPYKSVIPSRVEQRKITIFLDHETAKIDTLIEKQQQLIELLKEKRQAVISHAVTKGLNPDVPMKDSGVEWLGDVPEHWRINSLNHVLAAIGDVDHYMPQSVDDGIPYVMTGDLTEFVSGIQFSKCKQVNFRDYLKLSKKIKSRLGDVIMARYATIGTVSYVDIDKDFLVSYSCVTIKPNPSKVVGLYLYYYFKSNSFLQGIQYQVNTNTQGNVGINDLSKMKIVLPSIKEQEEIIAHLQLDLEKLDYLSTKSTQAINLMQERRTALISAAVTGKIDVRDWVAPDAQDIEAPQEATA